MSSAAAAFERDVDPADTRSGDTLLACALARRENESARGPLLGRSRALARVAPGGPCPSGSRALVLQPAAHDAGPACRSPSHRKRHSERAYAGDLRGVSRAADARSGDRGWRRVALCCDPAQRYEHRDNRKPSGRNQDEEHLIANFERPTSIPPLGRDRSNLYRGGDDSTSVQGRRRDWLSWLSAGGGLAHLVQTPALLRKLRKDLPRKTFSRPARTRPQSITEASTSSAAPRRRRPFATFVAPRR
jgi:hypothetical protein